MAELSLRNISKTYGASPILRDVRLDVADGEFVAVVGPSGCGKSTLLRIIAGLETDYSGEVRIGDRAVDALKPGDRDIAMVFQSYALYPQMTVRQNVALPLLIRQLTRMERLPLAGMFRQTVRQKRVAISHAVERAAAMVAIDPLLDRKPRDLSGGQRQRVALARAMIREPKLFLLDEPLSNLDASLRSSTRGEIVDLQRRLGVTTLFVTHDQTEAMTMADRIVVLMDGEVIQCGTPQQLYDAPADLRVARFIGSPAINILPTRISNGQVKLPGAGVLCLTMSELPDGAGHVGIRPEDLSLCCVSKGSLNGVIRNREYLGSEQLLYVSLEACDQVVCVRAPSAAALESEHVGLYADIARMHVFDQNGRRVHRPAPAEGRTRQLASLSA